MQLNRRLWCTHPFFKAEAVGPGSGKRGETVLQLAAAMPLLGGLAVQADFRPFAANRLYVVRNATIWFQKDDDSYVVRQ